MIDFHTHSFLSDGELIPSELASRAEAAGYRVLGIADHVDTSNADFVVPRLAAVCRELSGAMKLEVFAGAEVTHVPPALIAGLVARCRDLGAEYVIIHGETIAEPVAPGTLDAALEAGPEIIAHPGVISLEQAKAAAEGGVFLELSCRQGHCLTNGRVVRMAREAGAKLLIGTDAHAPCDLVTVGEAARIALGAGLSEEEVKGVMRNAEALLARLKNNRTGRK